MAFRNSCRSVTSTGHDSCGIWIKKNIPWSPASPVPFRSVFPEQLFQLQETIDVTAANYPRARTMKDYDEKITTLEKENFDLKLKIYLLEQKLLAKFSNGNSNNTNITKTAADLSLEVDVLTKEIYQKHDLLLKASTALDNIEKKHQMEMQQLKSYCHKLENQIKALEKQREITDKQTTEDSDSSHSNSYWCKQAFSLDNVASETETVEKIARKEFELLSTEELMKIVESQRITIANLTVVQQNNMTEIEKHKSNLHKRDKIIKGLCEKLSKYVKKEELCNEDVNECAIYINCFDAELIHEDKANYQASRISLNGSNVSTCSSESDKFQQVLSAKNEEIEAIKSQVTAQQSAVEAAEFQLKEALDNLEFANTEVKVLTDTVTNLKFRLKERDGFIDTCKNVVNKIQREDFKVFSKSPDSKLFKCVDDLSKMLSHLSSHEEENSQVLFKLRDLDLIQESQITDEASCLHICNLNLKKEVEELHLRLHNFQIENEKLKNEVACERKEQKLLTAELNKLDNSKSFVGRMNELSLLHQHHDALQDHLNIIAEKIDSNNGNYIQKIETDLENLKEEMKKIRFELKSTGTLETNSLLNIKGFTSDDVAIRLHHSEKEVHRLRFLLNSTENTVRLLSNKVQVYKRLLDEANIVPSPVPNEFNSEFIKGVSRSAPITPSKDKTLLVTKSHILSRPLTSEVECQTMHTHLLLNSSLEYESDCNETKQIFRNRLEELAEFLEKLLNFDENGVLDLSNLTPENVRKFQKYIENSIDLSCSLSRSLKDWESSSIFEHTHIENGTKNRRTATHSPRRKDFKSHMVSTAFKKSPKRSRLNFNISELISNSHQLGSSNGKLENSVLNLNDKSESDVWSEPDLNISKQRIGLSQNAIAPSYEDCVSSTESEISSINNKQVSHNLIDCFSNINQPDDEKKQMISNQKHSPRSLAKHSKTLNRRLEDSLNEIATLKQQLQHTSCNYNSLLEEFEQWHAANSSSAELYDKYKDTVRRLQELNKQQKSELQSKEFTICNIQREKENLLIEISNLTEKFESYEETIESLQLMLLEREKISKDASKKVELLEETLKEKQIKLDETFKNLSKTTTSLDEMSKMLSESEVLIESLQNNVEKESRENNRNKIKLSDMTGAYELLKVNHERCQNNLNEQKKICEEHTHLMDEQNNNVAVISHQLTECQILLQKSEHNFEKVQLELFKVHHDLEEAQSSNSSKTLKLESLEIYYKDLVERLNQEVSDLQKERVNESEKLKIQSLQELPARDQLLKLNIGKADECQSSITSPESASSFMYLSMAVGSSSEENSLHLGVTERGKSSDEGFDNGVLGQKQNKFSDSGEFLINSSPDLGIESDLSRFSSLDRQHESNKKKQSILYLEPGFPVQTNWNVVNSVPVKSKTLSSDFRQNFNHTYCGELRNDSLSSKVASDSHFSDSNGHFSFTKIKLIYNGNFESLRLVKEIKQRVQNRIISFRTTEADKEHYYAWKTVYDNVKDLHQYLVGNDELLKQIYSNRFHQNSDKETLPFSKEDWQRLQLALNEERQRAENALRMKTKFSTELKEKWSKAITKQLALTSTVLEQASCNVEKRSNKMKHLTKK